MSKSLIIVESPAKARTITRYLGGEFDVRASVGHVRDLPTKVLGVDIEAGFEPAYEIVKGKKKVVDELKKAARNAPAVYLAPDPDREGEAIAWHIAELLGLPEERIRRVLFHEITEAGIRAAMASPGGIDRPKVESQQARRILDRIVGYKLSPLLWNKIRRGLSAGRVQSVALRMVVDREREIAAFVPVESWNLHATLRGSAEPPFRARLARIDGEKRLPATAAEAQALAGQVEAARDRIVLAHVERKEQPRRPVPPFITSSLQQEAFRKFRFPAKKTMGIAQKLYEGVELGPGGAEGLITYMRTDSVRVAPEAVTAARQTIAGRYGEAYLSPKPRFFRNKNTAQDAHEAIRPTRPDRDPESLRPFLTPDDLKVYGIVWKRFLASQMADALYDTTIFSADADHCRFEARGSVQRFDGFMRVYTEGRDIEGADDDETPRLPDLPVGDRLALLSLEREQKFSEPPPRYSEALLIKALEQNGIGRPSTYASIVSTLTDKEYVEVKEGRYRPTELGGIVCDQLVGSFSDIMDLSYTARLEEQLDRIEEGQAGRLQTLSTFWERFAADLERAASGMEDVKRRELPTGLSCERCGRPMVIRWGQRGSFIGCSGYPACKNTGAFERLADGSVRVVREQAPADRRCGTCGGGLMVKSGRYGRFYACEKYPDCSYTSPIGTGVACPEQGCSGELVEKRSHRGKTFWSCNRYPACKYATSHQPLVGVCPLCGFPVLTERRGRDGSVSLGCGRKGCRYRGKPAGEGAGEGENG